MEGATVPLFKRPLARNPFNPGRLGSTHHTSPAEFMATGPIPSRSPDESSWMVWLKAGSLLE